MDISSPTIIEKVPAPKALRDSKRQRRTPEEKRKIVERLRGPRDPAPDTEGAAGMITLPANTRVWIAAGVTDLRRGFVGLSALVQTALEHDPYSGHVFVFRGRRGDLIKLLWWDGDGLCPFAKRLERRPLHLAEGADRDGGINPGAAFDAAGMHRLAAAGANRRVAVGDLSTRADLHSFSAGHACAQS